MQMGPIERYQDDAQAHPHHHCVHKSISENKASR